MTNETLIPAHDPRVAWGRVALFYGIALGGISLVGALMAALGVSMLQPLQAVAFGAVAMLFPGIAGFITERVAGRRTLLSRGWARFRATPGRVMGRLVLWSVVGITLTCAGMLVGAWVFSGRVPGAGSIATQAELDATLRAMAPDLGSIPVGVLVVITFVQALSAGFTLNGLLAFGEEYGWRGVLADELAPLGAARANLLTGVIWGLWHAPLIALGHNYGADWLPGIFLFVVITTPLSFILWWAREKAGSVAAAAVVHGAFNGFAGTFVVLLVGGSRLVALPVGWLAGLVLAVVAVVLWRVPGLRPAHGDTHTPGSNAVLETASEQQG